MRFLASVLVGLVCVFTTVMTHDVQATDESLVLYLPFDEAVPVDHSQYGHDVELVGDPAWEDGKCGKAFEFDGTNYVMVPINDTLQLSERFTVEFWVKKAKSQRAGWNYMVAGGSLKWAVILNADQKVYVYTAVPGWSHRMTTDEVLPEDWTHIAMIYDVDEGVEVYFNGELAGTGAKPLPVAETDGSIMVGARHPGSEFFTGVIDEVALYNRILTLEEIERDMEAVGGAAVSALDKLASTWGQLKNQR